MTHHGRSYVAALGFTAIPLRAPADDDSAFDIAGDEEHVLKSEKRADLGREKDKRCDDGDATQRDAILLA